jgi:RNA polymerase sigma-70 factor, ECF subfamily
VPSLPSRRTIDRDEVKALFSRYGPLVLRRARRILGTEAEAEDATQDVFIKVLASIETFRGESQPSTWLYRITTNLCLNRLRDHRRHRDRLAQENAGRLESTSESGPPEHRITISTLLAELPPELSETAVYYYVDEMDQEEIAKLSGIARRTVGYRLERFRALALERLGDTRESNDIAVAALAGGQKVDP